MGLYKQSTGMKQINILVVRISLITNGQCYSKSTHKLLIAPDIDLSLLIPGIWSDLFCH